VEMYLLDSKCATTTTTATPPTTNATFPSFQTPSRTSSTQTTITPWNTSLGATTRATTAETSSGNGTSGPATQVPATTLPESSQSGNRSAVVSIATSDTAPAANQGAIIGGAVGGGILCLILTGGVVAYLLTRKRGDAQPPPKAVPLGEYGKLTLSPYGDVADVRADQNQSQYSAVPPTKQRTEYDAPTSAFVV
jgi:hypothetical protein